MSNQQPARAPKQLVRLRWLVSLAGVAAVACQDPTQLTLDISTDALCVDADETFITLGRLGDFDRAPSATTKACADDGRIGDLVLVPSEGKSQAVAFEVVLGVGKQTAQCMEDGYLGGCIVARRSLAFVPRRPLKLPIELELACLDVPCGATETCRNGLCVSAELSNPESCTDPAGCGTVDGTGGANGSGGAAGSGGAGSGGAGSGGASGVGGSDGAGGASASGGASAGGGGMGSGGASASGGSSGVGGSGGGTSFDPEHSIWVTTALDVTDGDTSSILALSQSPGADGAVSLREALLAANATPNLAAPDEVLFAIDGTGPFTILLASPLPTLLQPLVVDATSQNPSAHWIEIDGSNTVDGVGLHLASGSDGSTLRGLVITGFGDAGILLEGSGNHLLEGNYLGVRADGTTAQANYRGLRLLNSADNVIGGRIPTLGPEGNVISGNTLRGILVEGSASQGNTILGNFVGLTADGTAALGNGADGIYLRNGPSNNTIGSANLSARNVVSANGESGIRMLSLAASPATDGNVVIGNYIGGDVSFSTNATLGNAFAGIRLQQNVNQNRIGGVLSGEGNTIAHNGWAGIWIGNDPAPQRNSVLGNHLRDNGGLGIELWESGGIAEAVTPNDLADTDVGSNALLNFPEFSSVAYVAGSANLEFTLDVAAGTYRIEFFESSAQDDSCQVDPASPPACLSDASGPLYYGEGWTLVHAQEVTHGGSGSQTFQSSFAASSGMFLTATCTEILSASSYGATSEFSRAVPMTFP